MTDNPKLQLVNQELEDKFSDSFVIDVESFSNVGDKDIAATTNNPIIKLQRSISRKVWHSSEKQSKISNDNKDSSPPRGSCTPEKATSVGVGTSDHGSTPQVHHQITVTAATDGRSILRRNSFKRSSPWLLDPRKIVFAFATLSSMGTILLIYLTLSISKYGTDENGLDWQQQ